MSGATIRAVDLFCSAGGLSTGLSLACEDLDRDVELVAVNHCTTAIETHKRNHPWTEHLNAKVEELHTRRRRARHCGHSHSRARMHALLDGAWREAGERTETGESDARPGLDRERPVP